MSSGSLSTDLPYAFAVVWLLLSIILAAAAAAPLILPAETLQALFPACPARLRGEPCILCGMTTAYLRIAEGDWTGAVAANPAAVPLYGASWLNFVAVSAYWIFKGKRCNFLH